MCSGTQIKIIGDVITVEIIKTVFAHAINKDFLSFKNCKFSAEKMFMFFLFVLQNIDCGYTLEPPHRGGSNEYPQSMFVLQNIDCGYSLEPPR